MAENNSFWRRRWKLILNIVTIAALVLLVYAIRKDLADTIENIKHVNAWLLLLLIPLQMLNYHGQTKLYQNLFDIVGNKLDYKFLYKAALELNFVNHVFPSGGAAGISYFGLRLKTGEITAAKATLMQICDSQADALPKIVRICDFSAPSRKKRHIAGRYTCRIRQPRPSHVRRSAVAAAALHHRRTGARIRPDAARDPFL